jgi:hypothetical protein
MIVSEQMVTTLAAAAFPTFAVLIGILINNQRLEITRLLTERRSAVY